MFYKIRISVNISRFMAFLSSILCLTALRNNSKLFSKKGVRGHFQNCRKTDMEVPYNVTTSVLQLLSQKPVLLQIIHVGCILKSRQAAHSLHPQLNLFVGCLWNSGYDFFTVTFGMEALSVMLSIYEFCENEGHTLLQGVNEICL